MRILKFKFVGIVLILLLLSGCINEIPLHEQSSERKLTLSALLKNGGDFRVKIGTSIPITSMDTVWIDNASIFLWEDGVLIDTMSREGRGAYYSPVFIQRGSVYTIKIQAEGYESITATDTVPSEIVPIENVVVLEDDYMDSYGDLYDTHLVEFEDGTLKNYYELFFIERLLIFYSGEIQTAFLWGGENIDPVFAAEACNEHFVISRLFMDNQFTKVRNTLSITTDGAYGTVADSLFDFEEGDYMVLRNTSIHYYEFRRSLANHLYNQQQKIDFEDYSSFLFESNPEPLYSNVENGYGIFAFYTQHAYKIPKN